MKNLRVFLLFVFLLFISTSVVKAESCVYKNGNDYTISCGIDGKSCQVTNKNGNYVVGDLTNYATNDFKNGCASEIGVIVEAKYINNKHQLTIKTIVGESNYANYCIHGICNVIKLTSGPTNNTGTGNNPTTPNNPGNNTGAATNPTNSLDGVFCTGAVQGVFTTLGWVFYMIKILIPAILIIMGSIDFAKAIIASKDDEIKKSAISLAKRAIVGVLIFFIPTILNFIVSFIDNDNVYKGTFVDCTKCMLDPTDPSCSSLLGGK